MSEGTHAKSPDLVATVCSNIWELLTRNTAFIPLFRHFAHWIYSSTKVLLIHKQAAWIASLVFERNRIGYNVLFVCLFLKRRNKIEHRKQSMQLVKQKKIKSLLSLVLYLFWSWSMWFFYNSTLQSFLLCIPLHIFQ